MVIGIERISRQQLILLVLLTMLAGLFFSRVLLSVSMIVFMGATCFHKKILHQIRNCFRQNFFIGLAFLFFIPFISGLWSTDLREWLHVVRIKVPLLFLPIAFAGSWQLSGRQWRTIFYIFLSLVFGGCCWSLWQYAADAVAINENYLKAKSIPTPFENDHVRYSWVVAVAAAGLIMVVPYFRTLVHRLVLIATAIFFVGYLHILSARTGLFCLYFFILIYFLHALFRSGKKKVWYVLIIALFLMPALAWFSLPTFQNRVRYILYDLSFIKKGVYFPGGNDGNRALSIKAGWHTLSRNFFGVGAGDVRIAASEWYTTNVPGMLPADKLLPSSEWLVYGATAGWAGVAAFTIIMLLPLVTKINQQRFAWIAINSMAALSFLFDIGLEVQFGVFVYTFIVLCCYKWIGTENKLRVIS
jgi:O-antigen ligase